VYELNPALKGFYNPINVMKMYVNRQRYTKSRSFMPPLLLKNGARGILHSGLSGRPRPPFNTMFHCNHVKIT